MRMAASCRWWVRATAPGMPERAPGSARPTSIPVRSASRSSIRATCSATGSFARGQIEAVIGLCRGITARHAIPPERVLAHSDVAPGRKVDPGEKFPWRELALFGVGHFVTPVRVGAPPSARPRGQRCGRRETAIDAVQLRLWRRDLGLFDARQAPWCGLSSCISGPGASTAWPTARRSRRCGGCFESLPGDCDRDCIRRESYNL